MRQLELFANTTKRDKLRPAVVEPVPAAPRGPTLYTLTPKGAIRCQMHEARRLEACLACRDAQAAWKAFWSARAERAGVSIGWAKLAEESFRAAYYDRLMAYCLLFTLENGGWPTGQARQWLDEADAMLAAVEPWREKLFRLRMVHLNNQTMAVKEYHAARVKGEFVWRAGDTLLSEVLGQKIDRPLGVRMSKVTGIDLRGMHNRKLTRAERLVLGLEHVEAPDWRPNEVLPEDYYA